jgi:hypothetical protein
MTINAIDAMSPVSYEKHISESKDDTEFARIPPELSSFPPCLGMKFFS